MAADVPIEALQALVDLIGPFFVKLSVVVGGIFGLYFILILARVYYERKKVRLLQHIRYDLDHLNYHFKLPTSRQQIGFFHKYVLDVIYPGHKARHYQPPGGEYNNTMEKDKEKEQEKIKKAKEKEKEKINKEKEKKKNKKDNQKKEKSFSISIN